MLQERIHVMSKLGEALRHPDSSFENLCEKAFQKNNWFTSANIKFAATVWGDTLIPENLMQWAFEYETLIMPQEGRRVAVINAGNIPFAGMHDLLSVYLTGNHYIGKNASNDPYLMPFIVELLIGIDPKLKERFQFEDNLAPLFKSESLDKADAIIATGNDNSARYFEYYFRNIPHVIRHNRNAVAVLNGKESSEDLKNLGNDIFQYFGMGCRNVSKLYVPKNYSFNNFFESISSFSSLLQHNKYMNNFEYHHAILLMKRIPFLQNGFLIVREEKQIPSPIAILHYEEYDSIEQVTVHLDEVQEQIQCVVTNEELGFKTSLHDRTVALGEAQHPALWDYSDGVDTVKFLTSIKK